MLPYLPLHTDQMSAPTPSPARVPYLGTYILPYLPLHTNQMCAPTPSPARATIPRYLHLPLHTDQMSAPTPSPARVRVSAAGDAVFSNVAVSATAGGGGVWVSGGIIAGAGALLVAIVWR